MPLERWIPPVLLDWYRSSRGKRRGFAWEGVYRHYRDVPARGSGFASEHWIKETLAYTRSLMYPSEGLVQDQAGIFREESFLALLISIHAAVGIKTVRVVDFGGGMGNAYIHFRNNSVIGSNVEYHIVENEPVCDAGRDLLLDDPRVHFHSSLPAGLTGVDIVYICSALQYIEDYPGLLKALCAYRPKYFLFVKLSAGDIPTYATEQRNLPGIVLPYWFLNAGEIRRIMEENGFRLIYRCLQDREYDQGNFPPECRLGRAWNLLFEGASDAV
jgi:putative methyltransferase (TIGR04325 family)